MSDRLKDSTAWWQSNPPVSDQFHGRVEKHGLYVALDMIVGFDWRADESEFPPKAVLRRVA
jgi:hypothetical protein